ncbi:DNA recombinase, partial [Citrobacter werkmanii]|uniref:recombinase RecT n=1 Tax=Citrobacter werkmanii TaxID=67827 RepID=UPI0010F39B1F
AEIKATEATSKAKNGPWKNFWEEMARKTIVKRASKYWPRAERLDNAIHVINEDEGVYQEPVMAHKSEEDIREDERRRQQEVIDYVQTLCDEMAESDSMDSLKRIFAEAYKRTQGMKLQQNVQAIYAECKAKLEVTSE